MVPVAAVMDSITSQYQFLVLDEVEEGSLSVFDIPIKYNQRFFEMVSILIVK